MILKSSVYEVVEIKKKTKAKLFGDIKVGDLLQFETRIKHVGGASNGIYATYIKTTNLTQKTSGSKSQTETVKYLDYFELIEVED